VAHGPAVLLLQVPARVDHHARRAMLSTWCRMADPTFVRGTTCVEAITCSIGKTQPS